MKRPEDYLWCSIGYHIKTGNRHGFIASGFGMADFGEADATTQFRKYREFLYHVGAIEKKGRARISKKVLVEASAEGCEMARIMRFSYKTRYFTDSGIIGFPAFVEMTYVTFKGRFQVARVKIPKAVKGIDGMYSLKRLADI